MILPDLVASSACPHSKIPETELIDFDLLIRNGSIIDGTGAARFRADIAIQDDQISAIGDLSQVRAEHQIDATDRVVAPGFIDVHNHSDGWLIRKSNFVAKTAQGFTTEVLQADGIGYAPVNAETAPEWLFYLRALDGLRLQDYTGWKTVQQFMQVVSQNCAQNSATHIPYANVRSLAAGFGCRGVDDFQMREIQRQIQIGMEAGAVGVSTGLDYIVQCHATTQELSEALTAMAPYDGLYVTHVRYKKGLLPALEEAVQIGRQAGVRVHISHLKAQAPEQVEQVLELLERAGRDIELTFDVYPYQPGSTMLNYLLPYEIWDDGPTASVGRLLDPRIRSQIADGLRAYRLPLDKIRIAWVLSKENSHHQGTLLADYIEQSGQSAADALADLLIEERMAALLVVEEGDDQLVTPFLRHERFMLGTDGIFTEDGQIHPRVYGSVGRFLGPLVREQQLMPLEEAIHRLSGKPAEVFRLDRRGVIRKGSFADLTIFDPTTIHDRATYEDPHQTTVGLDCVIVNGVVIHPDPDTRRIPGRFVQRRR